MYICPDCEQNSKEIPENGKCPSCGEGLSPDLKRNSKILNHWGVWVDSEIPITGVYQNNHIEFLDDEIFYSDSINLTFETWVKEENPSEEEQENYMGDNDTWLIGRWKKDENGLYIPDESGEYSAIVGEICTQVVWSRLTERHALCSPCYAGQGDVDTEGEFLTFVLPSDIVGNGGNYNE